MRANIRCQEELRDSTNRNVNISEDQGCSDKVWDSGGTGPSAKRLFMSLSPDQLFVQGQERESMFASGVCCRQIIPGKYCRGKC